MRRNPDRPKQSPCHATAAPDLDAVPPVLGSRGHPLQKPQAIVADRGYRSEPHRQELRERGIKPVIAERRIEHGSGLGKYRWVLEITHADMRNFRCLHIRFERRGDMHKAFLNSAVA
jgi:IS5 family transposase